VTSGLTEQLDDLAAQLERLRQEADRVPEVTFVRAAEGLMPRQVRLLLTVDGTETAVTLDLHRTVELQATLLQLVASMVAVSPYDELAEA
jgi:hypothetical protein